MFLSCSSNVTTHPEHPFILEKIHSLRQIIQVKMRLHNSREEMSLLGVFVVGKHSKMKPNLQCRKLVIKGVITELIKILSLVLGSMTARLICHCFIVFSVK